MYTRRHKKQPVNKRHIPQMLAAERKKQTYVPRAKKRFNIAPVRPSAETSLKYTLLILMILLARVAQAAQKKSPLAPRIHGKAITPLSNHHVCQDKKEGISEGKVCQVDGKTYYLKLFTEFSVARDDKSHQATSIVSHEEFNREFIRKNIGIAAPQSRFFRGVDKNFYIGTEEVKNLKFCTKVLKIDEKCLTANDEAYLAVAKTFVNDLHEKNYGYDDKGLVIIDADAAGQRPMTIHQYIGYAAFNILTAKPLSIDQVRRMINIYQQMKSKPLPEFHDEVDLTEELYQELLRNYIKICEDAIALVKFRSPKLSETQPDQVVNSIWEYFAKSMAIKLAEKQPRWSL